MTFDWHRRDVLRLGASGLVAGIAGCLGGGSKEQTVSMGSRYTFEPKTITVETGRTVVWTNDSDIGHTVTAYEDRIPGEASFFASGGFDSEAAARNNLSAGMVASGESYEHTFEVAGTYEYYCIPHESSGMVGTVEVE